MDYIKFYFISLTTCYKLIYYSIILKPWIDFTTLEFKAILENSLVWGQICFPYINENSLIRQILLQTYAFLLIHTKTSFILASILIKSSWISTQHSFISYYKHKLFLTGWDIPANYVLPAHLLNNNVLLESFYKKSFLI